MQCCITGKTDDLIEVSFNSDDYGYFASKLSDRVFTFWLCEEKFNEFLELGTKYMIGTEEAMHNNTYKFGKFFSCELVNDFIQTFKYVPQNWYRQDYHFLEYDEEQWLWENKSRTINDLIKNMVSSDRKKAIIEVLHYYGV